MHSQNQIYTNNNNNNNNNNNSNNKFAFSHPQKERSILYIFTCLQATYGNNWRNQFKSGINDSDGVDTGLKTAQKFWLQKLDFFFNSKNGQQAIKDALNNLPLRPPNLIEFYELVKTYWTQLDIKREQDMCMQQLENSPKLTPEQQREQKLRIRNIINDMKELFSKRANMFN